MSRQCDMESSSSLNLIKALEKRRLKDSFEKKRLKDDMKAKETPEEKRVRRLKEREAKEMRRRERMGWDTEYQHYTDQDNPFGDSNLTSTFVWRKKLEKDGLRNVSTEAVDILSRQKLLENKLELEKVKKRRLERELEKQVREEQSVLQQRVKEAAQFQEWELQEDQFHLEQARLRSVIRIQDGRAKPIDLLAQYLSGFQPEDTNEIQMHEPYVLLNGLSLKDLEDLLIDIKIYVELDKGKNTDFWNDMTVIVEDELFRLRKNTNNSLENGTCGRREGIHDCVAKDVAEIFRKKNAKQLNELRFKIENKIKSRSDGVDISYWESLLSQLKAHMARARLRDKHQENLRQKLNLLKNKSEEKDNSVAMLTSNMNECAASFIESGSNVDNEQKIDTNTLQTFFDLYEDGRYSPKYISSLEDDNNLPILTEEENYLGIELLRTESLNNKSQRESFTIEERNMCKAMRKDMGKDEAEFSVEVPLEVVQVASDKYRPRKPRYFNRVHTGFEWNKYNQTHYDMDNPPPKIVQGYKFNIFYPDLIDKNVTPQYFLKQCEDNSDFAVLRFHAGPPYEDIAFKIVHREWEFSYKRGFRCQFHNNIFQLWFHFKRYRYRR
ncbi:PREDICTED: cactin [Bactrocera latifrons]|uniref:Splicing factor Cactin n=1 Tax=Bactrocera latifrons TaxID=174628 RepID=A0A0K8V1G3_BACLA|nr:PREDICTED: cactin [Bactrocera latifrons]